MQPADNQPSTNPSTDRRTAKRSYTRRITVFVVVIAIAAIALIAYDFVRIGSRGRRTATSSATAAVSGSAAPREGSTGTRVLIVYFSRTTGVYDGPLKVGHTKRVADFIQEHTGGDEYEIIPKESYPDDYEETTRVAMREQQEDARPAIANPLPDVSDYDTVFIGSPIWWGEYPMVVRTFLDGVDLNGKTVIPFTTHEGSGLGNTREQLASQYPKATVRDGLAIRGGDADNSKQAVDDWLNGLGM